MKGKVKNIRPPLSKEMKKIHDIVMIILMTVRVNNQAVEMDFS